MRQAVEMGHIEKILLATDGSPASEQACDHAIDLASQMGTRLLVISVLGAGSRPSESTPDAVPDSRDSLTTKAQAIVARARAAGADAAFLVWEGDPGEAIVAAAESENVDLIIVGSHGRSGVSRFLIGSVSDYVVRNARCPVMVVRGKNETPRH
jgi:nucleotide-binding universal stress UspA family protein